jgi:hypothetical protein
VRNPDGIALPATGSAGIASEGHEVMGIVGVLALMFSAAAGLALARAVRR